MPENWIKVEKTTPGKPELLGIAAVLEVHPNEALGLCVRFWMWADDQLESRHARRVTKSALDAHLGRNGLSDALVSVGWLQVRNGSLEVPNFDRHLGASAKKRANSAERSRKHRQSFVTQPSRSERDETVTPSYSLSNTQKEFFEGFDFDNAFDEFWKAYPLKQNKTPARKAWEKAIQRIAKKERIGLDSAAQRIKLAADDYRAFLGGQDSPPKTKYAQGWLNDESYENDYSELLNESKIRKRGPVAEDPEL